MTDNNGNKHPTTPSKWADARSWMGSNKRFLLIATAGIVLTIALIVGGWVFKIHLDSMPCG
jgi:hypothetical protein